MKRSQASKLLHDEFLICEKVKDDKGKLAGLQIPVYIRQTPGLGMEDEIKDIADKLGLKVYQVSLSQYVRFPFFQIYKLLQIVEDRGILLLTDFDDLPMFLIMEIIGFLRTRRIGAYAIPDDLHIVICGNRDCFARAKLYRRNACRDWYDHYNTCQPGFEDRMEKGVDDEFIESVKYLSVFEDLDEQIAFAKEKHLHPVIIDYLEYDKGNSIYEDEDEKIKKLSTRTLERLSATFYAYEAAGKEITEDVITQYTQDQDYFRVSIYRLYMMEKYHFTRDVVDRICMGETSEDLKALFENAPRSFLVTLASRRVQMRFMDDLKKMPASRVSERLSNVIHFYQGLSMGEELLEKLLSDVIADIDMADVLSKIKNEDVLELCRKHYGMKKRPESALAAFESSGLLQRGTKDDTKK